jgi:hypothetical protein
LDIGVVSGDEKAAAFDPTNPMSRDTDEFSADLDEGDNENNHDGDTEWVILTTFSANVAKSGRVWAIPADDEDEG